MSNEKFNMQKQQGLRDIDGNRYLHCWFVVPPQLGNQGRESGKTITWLLARLITGLWVEAV